MTSVLYLLVAALLVAVDQGIKYLVVSQLAPVHSVQVIPGVLNFTYVENYGAAFGIFRGRLVFLVVLTAAILLVMIYLVLAKKIRHPVGNWGICLVAAGGVGNLIDRLARGFVVDYLDISPLFSYPVFNFADCCVVCGTALIAIYILVLEGRQHHSHEIKEIPPQDAENHREPTEEP